jgi:hypothetical protein
MLGGTLLCRPPSMRKDAEGPSSSRVSARLNAESTLMTDRWQGPELHPCSEIEQRI